MHTETCNIPAWTTAVFRGTVATWLTSEVLNNELSIMTEDQLYYIVCVNCY